MKVSLTTVNSLSEYFANMKELGEWLNGKIIAITGSTGFVGSAIADLVHNVAEVQDIMVTLVTLSRSAEPNLKPSSKVHTRHFTSQNQKQFLQTVSRMKIEHIFHFATPTSIERGSSEIENVRFATVGLLSELIRAASSSVRARLVNASSGAIYGPGHKEVLQLDSKINSQPWGQLIKDSYTSAKRQAEDMTSIATTEGYIEGTNARLFAFMGQGLPLTSHFAIGNFLWDSLYSEKIRLRGNPNSCRGFLPREILAANLLELMFSWYRPTCHVSSHDYHTLSGYANLFSEISGKQVEHLGEPHLPIDFYVGRADERFITNKNFDLREYLADWRLHEQKNRAS